MSYVKMKFQSNIILFNYHKDEEKKNLCISCFKDDISVLPFLCHVRTSRNGKFAEYTHHAQQKQCPAGKHLERH